MFPPLVWQHGARQDGCYASPPGPPSFLEVVVNGVPGYTHDAGHLFDSALDGKRTGEFQPFDEELAF